MPDEPTSAPPGTTDPPSGGAPPPTINTLTQEQFDLIIAREKSQAERLARKTQLEKLGFTSQEDLDKFVKTARDTELASMTEAERIKAEATTALAAATAEREAMTRERHTTTVERELLRAGAPIDKTGRLVLLVEVEPGADQATVAAAVEAVKVEFPQMFGAAQPPGSPKPSSEPATGGPPPSRTNSTTAFERGREAARARLGTSKPAS